MKVAAVLAVGVLLFAVVVSAVAVVWVRQQDRAAFVALTNLQNRRDALNVDFGRLELEQATWASPARIEQVARGQLGMISPPASSVEMIRE